jgi:phosphoserine phosphatase RsbU/P
LGGERLDEHIDLASLPILSELEPDLLGRLRPHCRVMEYANQDIILRKGRPNDHLHFLLDGRAEVHLDLTDRSEPIEIATGLMFGEISVIDQMPVTAYVIAAGPCRVMLLPATIFWSEVVTVPGVARTVMRRLSEMLRGNIAGLMRAMQERLRHAALERELSLARDIQMGMLRRADGWFGDRRDFQVSALIKPARTVGGDFYDAFLLDQDHLVVAIGDVAGKGISAALFMVRGLTLLRHPGAQWASLSATLDEANNVLAQDNDQAMFLTLFMGVLDLRTGDLDYVNFGHTWPLLRTPGGAASFHEVGPGVMFGIVPNAKGAPGRLTLPPGGALLLYSDGVTEAEDPAHRQLGSERLRAAAAAASNSPAELVGVVADTVTAHAGPAEQSDDITLLAVTWMGPAATGA